MSYTVVRDHSAEIDRIVVNITNIVRRRCKIGKVTNKPGEDWYRRVGALSRNPAGDVWREGTPDRPGRWRL